ncbi:anthranilate synthase component I [Texcoconibacillus texcoconensis]|uniref:Anthranilate synthase component 1 n=1 Tax=Texcoconibacillus texcoconensis TaxID=1095777 RepID=A0A840QNC7_9BACI|nr:anthranilate synthase component I [Texcoconibacillus texcoconensis]MBB5172886.1 anthranilate synthase component 1 [Texcoconibacillus texcoconensis]
MIETTFETFAKATKNHRTIPVVANVFVDTMTPVEMFSAFDEEACFILESEDPLSPWSNYSFIGLHPFFKIQEQEGYFSLINEESDMLFKEKTWTKAWDKTLEQLKPMPLDNEIPFTGGGVGYATFESLGHTEDSVMMPPASKSYQQVMMMFCRTILAYNHKKQQLTLIYYATIDEQRSTREVYEQAKKELARTVETMRHQQQPVQSFLPPIPDVLNVSFEGVTSNCDKETFIQNVEEVKNYIRQGDIFQAVLSQRFAKKTDVTGFQLYRVLRKLNPSPYLFYIRLGKRDVIGSSPERLVKISANREVEIHPIAGTRPRGKNKQEDEELADSLIEDDKERAEHFMLVDLARNDVGRVAEYGSVNVDSLMEVGKFSHVMHLISKVTGKLQENIHPLDAMYSAHPAGTVSGAPKLRAIEIIQQLEPSYRGIYSGAIAYAGFNGAIDSCIAIRTMILEDGYSYVQAGAGIVYDSIPENEWEETRNKAKALIRAVELAEEMFLNEEVRSS